MLCTPSGWQDVVTFYLGNFVAHAATVITLPGESTFSTGVTIAAALLFPLSGVLRGATAIMNFAIFAKSDLQTAARAGALYMLVRSDEWKPHPGDTISQVLFKPDKSFDEDGVQANKDSKNTLESPRIQIFDNPLVTASSSRDDSGLAIHGSFGSDCGERKLDPDYKFAFVPADAEFSAKGPTTISCNYSLLKALVALGQSFYAVSTLYQSWGDQITQYGYAAFGLTVTPYAIMSIVNLLGNLITPQYSAVYLVESSVMREARRRKGYHFDKIVGKLAEDEGLEYSGNHSGTNIIWLAWTLKFEGSRGAKGRQCHFQDYTTQNPKPAPEQEITFKDTAVVETSSQAAEFKLWIDGESETSTASPDNQSILFIPTCPFFSTSFSKETPQSGLGEPLAKPAITIHGEVTLGGKLFPLLNQTPKKKYGNVLKYGKYFLSVLVIAGQIAVIGGFSEFRRGSSTLAQRVWTMSWLSFGIFSGFIVDSTRLTDISTKTYVLVGVILLCCVFGPAAIGGFVVVGQMFVAYGNCIQIS